MCWRCLCVHAASSSCVLAAKQPKAATDWNETTFLAGWAIYISMNLIKDKPAFHPISHEQRRQVLAHQCPWVLLRECAPSCRSCPRR